jgi:hypothetical protein
MAIEGAPSSRSTFELAHSPLARRENVAEARHPIDGRRRLVVSSEYRRARDHPRQILSPLQSEFTWFLRILEGRKEVRRCKIRSWTGEFDAVSPALDGSVAVVRWNDQTEAGLVLVQLTDQLRQLEAAWGTHETNWLEGPTWTTDSQLLALVENPSGAGPGGLSEHPAKRTTTTSHRAGRLCSARWSCSIAASRNASARRSRSTSRTDGFRAATPTAAWARLLRFIP